MRYWTLGVINFQKRYSSMISILVIWLYGVKIDAIVFPRIPQENHRNLRKFNPYLIQQQANPSEDPLT